MGAIVRQCARLVRNQSTGFSPASSGLGARLAVQITLCRCVVFGQRSCSNARLLVERIGAGLSSSRLIHVGALMVAGLFCGEALARGPSPYLPLNLSPEIERQIERVMLLAGRPMLRRPFAAAAVLDALPDACKVDEVLCEQVRSYIKSYTNGYGVTHASVEYACTRESTKTLPNRRGMSAEDEWAASVAGLIQIKDYAVLQLGGIAYPDEIMPSGSWLSLGGEYLQIDAGFREHWWSPMTDSAMLIGTQAETMPSITVSNYTPLSLFGLRYEAFVARMARNDDIAFTDPETGDRTTSGYPRLAGLNLSI